MNPKMPKPITPKQPTLLSLTTIVCIFAATPDHRCDHCMGCEKCAALNAKS